MMVAILPTDIHTSTRAVGSPRIPTTGFGNLVNLTAEIIRNRYLAVGAVLIILMERPPTYAKDSL
jgi:hypothetical protein